MAKKDDFNWKYAEADVEDRGGDLDLLSRRSDRDRDSYLRSLDLNPDRYKPKGGSKPSSSGSEGCYVATAVYGSYDCPQVWTLRRYRDNTLALSWYGRAFIRIYYAISSVLARWFGRKVWFSAFWKPILDRMVSRLNDEGVADTPYKD